MEPSNTAHKHRLRVGGHTVLSAFFSVVGGKRAGHGSKSAPASETTREIAFVSMSCMMPICFVIYRYSEDRVPRV
jgi:hypothetical protein